MEEMAEEAAEEASSLRILQMEWMGKPEVVVMAAAAAVELAPGPMIQLTPCKVEREALGAEAEGEESTNRVQRPLKEAILSAEAEAEVAVLLIALMLWVELI